MNVLFLLSRFLDGGIDTVLVEYVNSMVILTNHKVTLAISIDYGKDAEVFLSRLDSKVKVVHVVSNAILTYHKRQSHRNRKNIAVGLLDEMILNPVRRHIISTTLGSLIKGNDVVIDFDSCHSAFIPEHCTQRKIAFYHFSLAKEMQRKPHRLKRFINRLARYDNVVTISKAMYDEAVSLCPDQKDKFCLIYNCIDRENIQHKASENVTDSRFENKYILAVERLEESQKDITTLINAYTILVKEHPDTPYLYIIGEGKSHSELESLIRQNGMSGKIQLLGFISNPAPWIRNAEVMVHSSKFEGLPTVLIEALLLGKIIVSTDCPTGPREILDDGKAGFLTEVGNAEKLAKAIHLALTDEQLRANILLHALGHAGLFTPESSIKKLEELMILHS